MTCVVSDDEKDSRTIRTVQPRPARRRVWQLKVLLRLVGMSSDDLGELRKNGINTRGKTPPQDQCTVLYLAYKF